MINNKITNLAKWFGIMSYYYFFDHIKAKKYQRQYNLPKPFKRIYHYHNKKTGGTSLNYEFYALSGNKPEKVYKKFFTFPHYAFRDKKLYTGWYKRLIRNAAYYYAHSHQPKHIIKAPKDAFSITIIRNPKDRIISNYRMLMDYYNNGINHPSMKIYKPMMGKGFNFFLDNFPKKDLLHQVHKFSKNYDVDEAFEGITNCSHYFLTEHFNQGIKDLNKKLNINLKPKHIRKSENKVKIKAVEIKKLKEMIEPELKLYKKIEKHYLRKAFSI